MHTIDLLEQALVLADQLGLRVRQEWLGGSGGGYCEIRGQKWLFVDLALTPVEQCEQVLDALRSQKLPADQPSETVAFPISHELRRAIALRKSA